MPLWFWVLSAMWLGGLTFAAYGWIKFMRPIREWENERLAHLGIDPQ